VIFQKIYSAKANTLAQQSKAVRYRVMVSVAVTTEMLGRIKGICQRYNERYNEVFLL